MARKMSVEIVGNAAGAIAAFERAKAAAGSFEANLERVGKKIETVGKSMTRNLTLPILGVGVAATKMALDFQQSMELIRTQAGATQGETDRMRTKVLALVASGQSFAQSANDMAKGLFFVESEGIRGAKALTILKTAAAGAAVGQTSLAETTNALTSAMKVYKLPASEAAATMATLNATVGAGKMHMEDLNSALATKLLPTAKALGISLPQVGAALDTFTQAGVPAAGAATNLTTAFLKFLSPTKASAKVLASMGLSSTDLANKLQTGGLPAALSLLSQKYEEVVKSSGKVKANQDIIGAFGGLKGGAAVLTLVQQYTGYMKNLQQVQEKSSPKTFWADVASAMHQPSEQIKADMAKAGAAAINLGTTLAPVAAKIANDIEGVVHAFDALPSPVKHAVEDFAALVAIAGPLVLVTGKLVKAYASLRAVLITMGVLKTVAAEEVAVGDAAGGAATKVALLEGRLAMLASMSPILIPIILSYSSNTKNMVTPGGTGDNGPVYRDPNTGKFRVQVPGKGSYEVTDPAAATGMKIYGPSLGGSSGAASRDSPQHAAAAAVHHAAASSSSSSFQSYMNSLKNLTGSGGGGGGGAGGGGGKSSGYKIPDALEAAIRKAQQTFANSATKAHLAVLDGLLKKEEADLKAHGLDAKAQSVANEITKGKIALDKAIAATMKAKLAAITAEFSPRIQAAQQAISTFWGRVQSDIDAALQKKFDAANAALAKQFFQGGQTPLEAKLAAMQAQDQASGLSAALTAAQKQLAADQGKGGVNYDAILKADRDNLTASQAKAAADVRFASAVNAAQRQLAADTAASQGSSATQDQIDLDQQAVTAAQRAIDENNLAIQATAERAQADQDYATALANLQETQRVEMQTMNDALDKFGVGLANGTVKFSDLKSVLDPFGVSLADIPLGTTTTDMANLSDATLALSKVMLDEADALRKIGDKAAADAAAAKAAADAANAAAESAGKTISDFVGRNIGAFKPPLMPSLDGGGDIIGTGVALVHAGESVVPTSSKGGGNDVNVTVNVNGFVGNEAQLANEIRNTVVKIARREPNIFGGRA